MSPSPTIDFSKEKPQRDYSAKYLYYLNEYHMRLKKSVGAPTNDAAGLLGGTRYHGRSTPLKGKGQPPAENREDDGKRQVSHKVLGRSWQPSDVFLRSRPTTADDLLYRSTKKHVPVTLHCQASRLRGGGVEITEEPHEYKRTRGRGTLSPDITVTMTRKHVVNDGYTSGELREEASHSGLRTWNNCMRPSTAGNDSILRHRYSLPDSEPSPMHLDSTRMAKPLVTHRASDEATRTVFLDSFNEYCWNKTRALYGGRFRMG